MEYSRGVVTLRDVARRAGVSASVVSAVTSGSKTVRMSAPTRERVEAAIAELGYRTNHAAKSLKMARTGIVSVIVPKLSNPVFAQTIAGIEDAAEESGDVVLVSDSDRIGPGTNLMHRLAGTGMADGFLVRSSRVGDATVDELKARGIPYVVLNGPPVDEHTCVWVDDRAGIDLATSALLDRGHRRIALVGGPVAMNAEDARAEGFRDAFTSRGLTPPRGGLHRIGYELTDVAREITDLLSTTNRPTAVVVDNITVAAAALAAAADAGLRVPQDLSIVGYHDVATAAFLRPAVTTVRMPVREAGERGFRALRDLIDGRRARSVIVRSPRPKLVLRDTVASI